jgi:hypothetical protein
MQNSYFFMGLRSLKKIGVVLLPYVEIQTLNFVRTALCAAHQNLRALNRRFHDGQYSVLTINYVGGVHLRGPGRVMVSTLY